MYANPAKSAIGLADESAGTDSSALVAAPSDVKVWLITTAIVAAMFLLLQNPYWVPGGDSEVYVAIARNIATGNLYRFNGQAAKIAPPGWPLVLAAVIKISPTFLALKLVTMACMLGGLSIYYWIIRRFASPKLSAAVIVLTAIISHVYSLTFWVHSDALFVLITAASVLLSLQINEGKSTWWRIALLMFFCAAAAFERWAGIINIVLVCAALGQGHAWPKSRFEKKLFAIGTLAFIVTFAMFFGERWWMTKYAPSQLPFEPSAQMGEEGYLQPDVPSPEMTSEGLVPTLFTRGQTSFITRVLGYGTWFSYLLWQPFRLALGWKVMWWVATAVGWVVLAVIVIPCVREAKAFRWLLPGVLLYTVALCVNWPQATARYFVPITPLLILAIFKGLEAMRSSSARWQRTAARGLGVVGIGSVILCNVALYSIDVWVMRSSRFYDVYEAGMNRELIAAAEYLVKVRAGNWQVCINPEYKNIGKRRNSPTGLRAITMLTGKACLTLPKIFNDPKYFKGGYNDRDVRKWLKRARASFYLEQPEVSPWRVWHFRMGWYQKMRTGVDPEDSGAGWKLYRCKGGETPILIPLPQAKHYPTRVPGF